MEACGAESDFLHPFSSYWNGSAVEANEEQTLNTRDVIACSSSSQPSSQGDGSGTRESASEGGTFICWYL